MKMLANELIQEKRNDIFRISSKYSVKKIQVFGSVARGEETSNCIKK